MHTMSYGCFQYISSSATYEGHKSKLNFILFLLAHSNHSAHMAPIITPAAAIVAEKINIKLRVRVIHLRTIPEFNKPNEDNSIHVMLLDDKVTILCYII